MNLRMSYCQLKLTSTVFFLGDFQIVVGLEVDPNQHRRGQNAEETAKGTF